MKRTFKSIMFVAAAAMAFTACNVEPIETPEVTTGTHTVKFIASQVDTKTTMDINDGVACFDWEEADVNYFYIFENEYYYEAKDVIGDIDENGAMQLMATFERGGTAPFTYFGFFAPTFFTYPQVPAVQTDNGKYDPMADILVAKPVTVDASQSGASLSFQFKRIVAINVMTLKGLAVGETVSEVKIVSDKPIAGKYKYETEEWYNSLDTQITVSANSVVNEKGEAVVYFVSAPVEDAQLTITATTAVGKIYKKELAKTISFTEGGVKSFGVTVARDLSVMYNVVPPIGLVGGTVSVDKYEAPVGETVTLTATPADGYKFVSWSVKDASDQTVTVAADNTFIMPASNVTVGATFEEIVTVVLDKTISIYTEGAKEAIEERHDLGDGFVIHITNCQFNVELRIYASISDFDVGQVVSDAFPGTIKELRFNAGYKSGRLFVFGKNDSDSIWKPIDMVQVEENYADYKVDFGDSSYTQFKIEATPEPDKPFEVRIKSIGVTYIPN